MVSFSMNLKKRPSVTNGNIKPMKGTNIDGRNEADIYFK